MNINIDKIKRIPMQERYKGSSYYVNKIGIRFCKSTLHKYFDFPKNSIFDLLICNKPFEGSYKMKLSTISSNCVLIDCNDVTISEWLMFNPAEIISENTIYIGIEY